MDSVAPVAVTVLCLAVVVFEIVAFWRVYEKAGQPGWGVLIPIYNVYLLVRIAGRPGWWTILFFIPVANIIAGILVPLDVADRFSKGTAFGVGLILLPGIFYPILGFGGAKYRPDAGG